MPDLVHGLALTLEAHSYESRVGGELSVGGPVGYGVQLAGVKRLTLLLHVPVFKVKRGVFIFLQT